MRKNFPLRLLINQRIQWLREAGLIDKWMQDVELGAGKLAEFAVKRYGKMEPSPQK